MGGEEMEYLVCLDDVVDLLDMAWHCYSSEKSARGKCSNQTPAEDSNVISSIAEERTNESTEVVTTICPLSKDSDLEDIF